MTKKYIPTQEMLDSLSKMKDSESAEKWNISRQVIIKIRKEYNITPFINSGHLRPHYIENGAEYKWCGAGHYDKVEKFGNHKSRWDGLRSHCKFHTQALPSSKKPRPSWQIRKNNAKRKSAHVLWQESDELRSMRVFENRCAYCGCLLTRDSLKFDHFIPIASGGKTSPTNMLPSCIECNRGSGGKFTKPPLEWLIGKFGSNRGMLIYKDIKKKQRLIAKEIRNN